MLDMVRVCRQCGDTPQDSAGVAEPICSDGIGVTGHSYFYLKQLPLSTLIALVEQGKGSALAEVSAELDRREVAPPALELDPATDKSAPTDPISAQRASLGRARLDEFMQANAMLHFNTLALVMSIASAPNAKYADEVLDAIVTDAHDLVDAANTLATFASCLARDWRAQRQEAEAA